MKRNRILVFRAEVLINNNIYILSYYTGDIDLSLAYSLYIFRVFNIG